jgi:uncharacterized protein with von Willebrand factor type A (vWA) domain
MAHTLAPDLPKDGNFVANITHFARALRKSGLPVGPGRVADAIRAVEAAGFTSKPDFYWALHACFVSRPEHRAVFAQIFRLYWRNPKFLEHMMAILLPSMRGVQKERLAKPAERRAAQALLDGSEIDPPARRGPDGTQIEIEALMTFSAQERLKTLDFEQMSTEEMTAARKLLAEIKLPMRPLASRRSRAATAGRVADWRNTMRRAMRNGGEIRALARRKRKTRQPNLVALCDISGSMSAYSRAVLHFLHAASNAKGHGWADVHTFTFGTRLTNITRHLRQRDVDAALALAGAEAQDWQGGTRIGDCLHEFNRDWSRRLLGQGGVVLLISDGLDRDSGHNLAGEMERLRLSARKLIWLNPLLRWDGFAPKAHGIRAMLPHVDSLRAGHNIASLEALALALSQPEDIGEKARLMQMLHAQ